MSLYNMIHGVSPITFCITPMLFDIHAQELPRFRDVFLDTAEGEPKYDEDIILIYTRVGGGNRGAGFGEEIFFKHPCFIDTYDDDFDSTYGNYVFGVPEQYKNDYDKIKSGNLAKISPELQARCRGIYPKLNEQWDKLWNNTEE